jgi:hypothetical protein
MHMPDPLAPDLVAALEAFRQPDGGFGPSAGAASEAEPTALAAIALSDDPARSWLAANQGDDGGFVTGPPELRGDAATPLAAIGLGEGSERDRAIDYLLGHQATRLDNDDRFPHDPHTRGWGWTSLTFGWVEPTSRALLALRLLRPDAADAIADGKRVLTDRECRGGGWNYGNREVLGKDYQPYLQTTAAAVMALHGTDAPELGRGLDVLHRQWSDERGGLGWAMTVTALRLNDDTAPSFASALEALASDAVMRADAVALGWAAIALGPGIERLRVGR